MTDTANTTDTAERMRCYSCGNRDAWWDGYVLHCEPCEAEHRENVAAIELASATVRRVEDYRESITSDSEEYREMLARAMQCDTDCTCRGTYGTDVTPISIPRDTAAMRHTTRGVTR